MTIVPGSSVTILDAPPPQPAAGNTGTAFLVGMALAGSLTGQLALTDAVHSKAEWETYYGPRQSYNGPEYDAMEAFFVEGGSALYFSRYAGPAAAKATLTVNSQFTATALSEGAWGNGLQITVATGVVTVTYNGTVVETFTAPTVGDIIAAVSSYVTFTAVASTGTSLTNAAIASLAAGADDRTNATDAQRQTALDRFGSLLGPGSVLMPGLTTTAAYTQLATHARDKNRFAYLDAPDSSSAATVASSGTAVRALGEELARHCQLLDPWLTCPGTVAGTTRTVPPSGVQAGMAARTDALGNPNRATAGVNGTSRFALTVKYIRTSTERGTLADAGVTVIRNLRGRVTTYDDITPVDQSASAEWLGAAGNRMVMRIISDALQIADAHMFGSVAGPADLAAFNGDLKSMLNGWFGQGALYSSTGDAAGAFRVETGSSVNTPTTLAARQLKAALSLKLSPNARQVIVQITNTPLQSEL